MSQYVYRDDVREALLVHGVRPTEQTPPELVREFVCDVYRHELRRLRDRLLRNEFPKHEYAGRVIQVRNRYAVLALRAREWLALEACGER
jgi:hypothetical protein